MAELGRRTATVKVQVASGLAGLVSLAVQVTVVMPSGKFEPEAGLQVTVTVTPEQLSLAVGAGQLTMAWVPEVVVTPT
jgi:hypothetical protein